MENIAPVSQSGKYGSQKLTGWNQPQRTIVDPGGGRQNRLTENIIEQLGAEKNK